MKVFVDTNVLFDVLSERQPFYKSAVRIWHLSEQGKIVGLISVISLTNLYYLVRRLVDRRTADQAICSLRDCFRLATCDQQIAHQAIDAGLQDFEDAMQYFSAVRAGAEVIVTRNPKHFPQGQIPVLTPDEFLANYDPQ